jgi:energy-coupling factor transport system permease protein
MTSARRLPRIVHPLAWWGWALGLVVAASRTTNPLLLAMILAVVGLVVLARGTDAPWARAFPTYLALGLTVIGLRVLFRIVLGGDPGPGEHILFTLPTVPLPGWMAGVSLGGSVSLEGVLAAVYDGMRLATLLCCIGAANALANPKRALRVLPGALYELGVAVTVGVTLVPQLVESVHRVRRARRLRGDVRTGRHAVRSTAMPVLHDALARSFLLAAAMDSRGYGRRGEASRAARRAVTACMVIGLLGLCAGSYGMLDASVPALLGFPTLLAGVVVSVVGLALGGRNVVRSRYRPDPWLSPEWITVLCGALAAAAVIATGRLDLSALDPSVYPPVWPTLPPLATVGLLLAALPAVATPPPPQPRSAAPRVRAATVPTSPPRKALVA